MKLPQLFCTARENNRKAKSLIDEFKQDVQTYAENCQNLTR